MANWFYYDSDGQKKGPLTTGQVKELARSGTITPETKIENEAGKSAVAGKIKGLEFPPPEEERPSLLAMPLLRDQEFNPEAVLRRLRDHWGIPIRDEDITASSQSDKTCAFNAAEHIVAMSLMPGRLPDGEIESLFPVSPYWDNAEAETAEHQSHVIVYLSSGPGSVIERYSLFTKVVESILVETNSLGVYQGLQTLLISRENYLDMAQVLLSGGLPLLLWIFIGMGKSSKGNTLYTYGLTGFDKKEMEIIDSKKDLGELYDFLLNICDYVISRDVTFKDGETVGYTKNADAKISISKGVHLEGDTIKLQIQQQPSVLKSLLGKFGGKK